MIRQAWTLIWGVPLFFAVLLVVVFLFIGQGPRAVEAFLKTVSL